jgi:two-component system, OmpR family, phosphate regulon sensor histidine kinase PhoR
LTGRIFAKLIGGVLGLLLLAAVTVDFFANEVTRDTYIQNLREQLTEKARMLALSLPANRQLDPGEIRTIAQAAGGRVTIVRSDGIVMADSEADPATMENHRTREELIPAFRGATGWSERHSATVGVSFLYVAAPAPGGAIRIAVPLSQISQQVESIRHRIVASTAIAFLPALGLAALLSRAISRRFGQITAHASELAKGNFRARLPESGAREFAQLARTLNETAGNLQNTMAQLEREHAELEKVERVRKDFVINVSHELRTPLASIQGYTETLLDGALNDPKHNMRFLSIIRHNAERLARLTEDLLTLSRVEQKRQKFEFETHFIEDLLQDAIDLMRPIAEKREIELVREADPAEATVCCDSEAVSQILSNLLDNAVKYTPPHGRITVGAKTDGKFVEVFVRDTGIGIPAEDLPRLFERFYRVDKARSRELGGTGLGLSIVKHLVAAQGGATRVESEVNQGSTFFFTLPADFNPEFTPA